MEHPNGCIHSVRDDLVTKFQKSGWKIKGEKITPPVTPEEPKKRNTKSKKR